MVLSAHIQGVKKSRKIAISQSYSYNSFGDFEYNRFLGFPRSPLYYTIEISFSRNFGRKKTPRAQARSVADHVAFVVSRQGRRKLVTKSSTTLMFARQPSALHSTSRRHLIPLAHAFCPLTHEPHGNPSAFAIPSFRSRSVFLTIAQDMFVSIVVDCKLRVVTVYTFVAARE